MNPYYTQRHLGEMFTDYQELDVGRSSDPLGAFINRYAVKLGFRNLGSFNDFFVWNGTSNFNSFTKYYAMSYLWCLKTQSCLWLDVGMETCVFGYIFVTIEFIHEILNSWIWRCYTVHTKLTFKKSWWKFFGINTGTKIDLCITEDRNLLCILWFVQMIMIMKKTSQERWGGDGKERVMIELRTEQNKPGILV